MVRKRSAIQHEATTSVITFAKERRSKIVEDVGDSIEQAADLVYSTDETTSAEVVEIARDAAESVSVAPVTSVESAPPAPELTATQVVVEAEGAEGRVVDTATTNMAEVVKTPRPLPMPRWWRPILMGG